MGHENNHCSLGEDRPRFCNWWEGENIVWILRDFWGGFTQLAMGSLEGPQTQKGKDQGGTSMGRWRGGRLEGSDWWAGHRAGRSPDWALPLIPAVWPVFLLNPILNCLFCIISVSVLCASHWHTVTSHPLTCCLRLCWASDLKWVQSLNCNRKENVFY